jgi:hypothetical protein
VNDERAVWLVVGVQGLTPVHPTGLHTHHTTSTASAADGTTATSSSLRAGEMRGVWDEG